MTKKSILTSFLAATAFTAASFASGASNTHGTTGSFSDKAPGHSLNANSSITTDTEKSTSYQSSFFIDLLDDAQKADLITEYTSETDIQPEDITIPLLNSKSGSSNVIYLDFGGEIIRNTAWNEEPELGNTTQWNALGYSLDDNRLTNTDAEKNAITEIWRRVSEDFAPFDVNVTTERPIVFTNTKAHVIITPQYDVHGVRLPHFEQGGVAYQDAFGTDDYAERRNIIFVQGDYSPSQIAEAISHEMGHSLGLSHDGILVDGVEEYYTGSGDWAPIMGNAYNKNITQWNNGSYAGATNEEDDIQIIASKLTLIEDIHGDSSFNATRLVADEFLNTSASGVINSINDVDTFLIAGELGNIQLNINSYSADRGTSGQNLVLEIVLQDRNGETIDPTIDISGALNYTLPETDAYYLSISSSNTSDAPDNYGSLGNYTISGTITPNNPRAPEASDDAYSLISEQNYFTTFSSGVLANDFDVNGDQLYAVKVTDPTQGKLAFNEDGSFAYFPNQPEDSEEEPFVGVDTFTYYVTDGRRNSEVVTVTLNIRGEVFPNDDGSLPTGWSTSAQDSFTLTPLSSDSNWIPDTFSSEGNYSLKSGPITHGEQTSLFYQGFTDAGTLSFRYRVSSEENFDFLTVIINNRTVLVDSGLSNWTTFSTEIPAGLTTIEFRYNKDFTLDRFIDSAWIDNVQFPSDTAPEDQAPQVDAGADLDVEISDGATIFGSVVDEGLPNGDTTITWEQISGPADATFSSTTTARTNVSFTEEGVYVFELSATDSLQTSFDQVTVTVGPDTINFYTVTFALGDQGTPTPGNEDLIVQEVAEGTSATEPIFTVDSDYVFSGWSFPFDNVDSNLLITARYILKEDFNPIPIYRLYNPNSGLHHFTQNQAENDYLVTLGWVAEGTPYRLLNIQEGDEDVTIDGVDATPFFRLYNWGNGEHFFTMNQPEAEYLRDIVAWYHEGNIGYGFQERVTFTIPLFRLYNPNSGFHHYTTSTHEQFILSSIGWNDEGITAWVYPDEDLFPDTDD